MQARLKPLLVAPGSVQMQADIEMLEEAAAAGAIIVRAGLWRPPAVSIGRRQEPRGSLDPGRVEALGLELVRRPTGGLTIVHEPSSFTIHAAIPRGHPLHATPVDEAAYEIARIIAGALREEGAPVEVRSTPWRVRLTPYPTSICLAYTSPSDIVSPTGRRVAGLALRRSSKGLLAQAFIMVGRPDYKLWSRVDDYPSPSHLELVMDGVQPSNSLRVEVLAERVAARIAETL